jgi:regulatory protein
LLDRLAERGWLDDSRYALAFARHRAEHRRFGRFRIARELRRRGLAEELIEQALQEVLPAEEDERPLINRRLERRLRNQKPPYSDKLLRSLYASLLRAGFSSAIIRDELFRRTRQTPPEDVAVAEDEGS